MADGTDEFGGMILAQVTPALPPRLHGVGDYALLLAGTLQQRGIDTCFVLPPDQPESPARGDSVDRLQQRDGEALATSLERSGATTVLAHFSGYCYARWGLCWWLVDGLERWRRQQPGRRLVMLFHELYATGPIWRTSFWTSWPQRRIAHNLAALSDAVITTSSITADELRRWLPGLTVHVSPVFSNMGELKTPRPLSQRAAVAVAFGGAGHRRRLFDVLEAGGAEGLRRYGITRVLDIGPPTDSPAQVAGLPVEPMGVLGAGEVSQRLSDARIGLLDYPLHVATKSGIFAAYFAHGLLAVNTSTVGKLPPDLSEGREFVHPRRLATAGFDAQAVADAGHAWYRGHDLDATTSLVHRLLS